MKGVRHCLLLAIAVTATLAGVSPATAAPATLPVGTITESRVSGNGLNRVTLGPDNKLWFTECGATSSIGRIDPAQDGQQDPAVDHFPTPTPGSCPIDITTGPGGNLWFTEQGAVGANGAFTPTHPAPGKIGRITPSGRITEYTTPTPFSNPAGITVGPDGNLWFTEYAYEVRDMPGVQHGGNKIGRITAAGRITEFPVPTPFARADGITAGPGGAVYFTESPGNNAYGGIGRAQAVDRFPNG